MFNRSDRAEILFPTDMDRILEKYEDVIENYPHLENRDPLYARYEQDTEKLIAVIPLKKHPVYGITGFVGYEKYNDEGLVERYSYAWRILVPKLGNGPGHITAWENDPHDKPNTRRKYRVATEPHHHHHVPFDRSKRKENYDVRTMDDAFSIVADYIRNGKPYP